MSNKAFPFYTSQWIEIGMSRVFAMRISYAGAKHVSIGTELEVRYMGRSYPAIVAAEPLYDPKSKRMKL